MTKDELRVFLKKSVKIPRRGRCRIEYAAGRYYIVARPLAEEWIAAGVAEPDGLPPKVIEMAPPPPVLEQADEGAEPTYPISDDDEPVIISNR